MQAGRISARNAVSRSAGTKALRGNGPARFERGTKEKGEVDRNKILLFFDNYYKNNSCRTGNLRLFKQYNLLYNPIRIVRMASVAARTMDKIRKKGEVL